MSKPNKIRVILSTAACKLTRSALRKSGRGGTAIPGKVAMKFAGNILEATSEGMEIVVVTGTNGKSTTCGMIDHAVRSCGHDCLYDRSGANLLSGITANLTCNAGWTGKPKTHYAVIECDEAALKQVVPLVHPKAVVVTNLFSDQVDRLGGVENTLEEIRKGVQLVPDTTLVLNADEPRSASLSLNVPNRVIFYGMNKEVGVRGDIDLKDAGVCPVCGGAWTYSYHTYAHLGGYRCEKCGWGRKDPDVAISSIEEVGPAGSKVNMQIQGKNRSVRIAIPAVYNISNAAAATAACMALGLSIPKVLDSLSSAKAAFGRLETFDLNGQRLQMILVKNPAGCNQAFSYLTGLKEDYTAVLCLNNRTGDGHDISWINDTDYEMLVSDPHLTKIYVAGECRSQLADRLKKAGLPAAAMQLVDDYGSLLQKLMREKNPVYALPNYTAMMELRKVLAEATGRKDFWE